MKFEIGDHVRWNSEAGPRHASKEEPQYEIQSDKTDHSAMHKGTVLHKID